MNDKELVSRMQHGDMQAFDELYERYKDDAYRLACLITGSRTDGEDLAQEAFVTCAQSIKSRRLYAALDTLDEKRRVTVVLYYFDDRSVREIAQATGVTEGTVKSRLFSARRHLRQALTEERKPKEAANHG